MATDITVRRVKGTSANINTQLASDLSTAGVNKADLITLTQITPTADCVLIVYTY